MRAVDVDIHRLIPQREPIMMVDRLAEIDEEGETALTRLEVRADNFFIHRDGLLSEFGILEHIAQSASAMAGLKWLEAGATTPPVGLIGEVKKFCCYRRPAIGETLSTQVTMGVEVGGVTLLTGETRVGDELIADTRMKIAIAGGVANPQAEPLR